MKKSINIVLALVFSTTLFFVGCRKKETTEVDNETQSAVDNAVADQEYAAIVPAVNSHAINTKGAGANDRMMVACDSLNWLNRVSSYTTSTGVVYPKADTTLLANNTYSSAPVYELDLASTCSNSFTDGKVRTGKWFVRITGPLRIPNNQMILQLQSHKTIDATPSKTTTISYSCDNIVVTTLATSTVAPTFTKYNVKLTNGICQTAAWTIKYNFDRTITTYPKGKTSTVPVTEVYGNANGVSREGRAFTVNIPQATQCIKHKACPFIDKGIIELTPDGFKTRTIDFGNGACDDDATYTVNGSTVAFKLK